MDIIGHMPPALGKGRFLLVCTDYFSKGIEAEAFPNMKDVHVEGFFKKYIIYCNGSP